MPHDSPTGARGETLYHYCGTKAFFSIVHNRSIWLSSLSLSNDTMEGRLGNETIMHLAERDELDASNREHLQNNVALIEGMFEGLGFCLSEEGCIACIAPHETASFRIESSNSLIRTFLCFQKWCSGQSIRPLRKL